MLHSCSVLKNPYISPFRTDTMFMYLFILTFSVTQKGLHVWFFWKRQWRKKKHKNPFVVCLIFFVITPVLLCGCSPGGAAVQAQPHQPDSERDGVSADGVWRGGPTSAPLVLVQGQPASPPNVRWKINKWNENIKNKNKNPPTHRWCKCLRNTAHLCQQPRTQTHTSRKAKSGEAY